MARDESAETTYSVGDSVVLASGIIDTADSEKMGRPPEVVRVVQKSETETQLYEVEFRDESRRIVTEEKIIRAVGRPQTGCSEAVPIDVGVYLADVRERLDEMELSGVFDVEAQGVDSLSLVVEPYSSVYVSPSSHSDERYTVVLDIEGDGVTGTLVLDKSPTVELVAMTVYRIELLSESVQNEMFSTA